MVYLQLKSTVQHSGDCPFDRLTSSAVVHRSIENLFIELSVSSEKRNGIAATGTGGAI